MRNLFSLCALLALATPPVSAQTELTQPNLELNRSNLELNAGSVQLRSATQSRFATQSLDETRAWQAVGRINIGTKGFCTGTLIAPDLVLTAAHCFFDSKTKEQTDASEIEFLAGWRSGRAAAYRSVRQIALHPEYSYQGPENVEGVEHDLALIRLEQPIRNSSITPFETSDVVIEGATVQVVSYAKDRDDAPSVQDDCAVLATDPGVHVTSCEVDFGSSGAPVFVMEEGTPHVMSVVSAKAEWRGQKVSLTASVYNAIEVLMAELERSDGVFRRNETAAGPLANTAGSLSETAGESGVLFLKP